MSASLEAALPATASARREPLPGDLAMWIFICAELAVFGLLLVGYAFARRASPELFAAGQATIDRGAGAIGTVLLLVGSWCVVRAARAIRSGSQAGLERWLLAAIVTGLGFVVFKGFGFAHVFGQGIGLSTNLFYTLFLLLTGFHYAHVLLGLVILTAVLMKARRGGYSAAEHAGVESGASYWHMVDLVWLVLFPLVYLVH